MNKAANTYWIDHRLRAQRVASRALPSLAPARDLSRDLIGTRTEIRRRGGVVPSWVVFATIILTTLALCVSVTVRTRAQLNFASQQHQKMKADVEALRITNNSIAEEVSRLNDNPRAIESAARTRLNMVRANEIIVPVE